MWLIDEMIQLIVMERHGSLVEIVSLIGGDGIAQKRGEGVAYYSDYNCQNKTMQFALFGVSFISPLP